MKLILSSESNYINYSFVFDATTFSCLCYEEIPRLVTEDDDGKFRLQLLHVIADGGGFLLLHSADAPDNDDGIN